MKKHEKSGRKTFRRGNEKVARGLLRPGNPLCPGPGKEWREMEK
jgi:hypothetical protein